jgi:L-alanine-DL-glutamate epimerase-like enolase superfamily enzyme
MTRELYEFRDLIAEGCLDVVQPDCALVGGITGLRRVAVMAREFNVTFTPHTWSNGFGVVANTHLTAGLGEAPFIEFPCDPPEWGLERRDYLLTRPFDHQDGWLQLSEAPGFGVELDEAVLAATRIG